MKFRDIFSLKQILFAVFVMVVMILFANLQGNNTVKVSIGEEQVQIKSSKYKTQLSYADIDSLELTTLEAPGEKLASDSYDDDILRCGLWKNDTWGEYAICVDLDEESCIVARLTDGSILVFNRKNAEETESIYQQLLTKLPA